MSFPLLSGNLLKADDRGLEVAHEARVVWDEPGKSSADSVPLGNGDIALNIWNEADGSISFYISKSDAWDGFARLIKVGLMHLRIEPNPFADGGHMEFCPDEGCVVFRSNTDNFTARIRVDANKPVIVVEIEAKDPVQIQASLDPWREKERPAYEAESAPGIATTAAVDHVVPEPANALVWYQRNEQSIWKPVLEFQGLGGYVEKGKDPLLHLTFGGCATGVGMMKTPDGVLQTASPQLKTRLLVSVLSGQTKTAADWVAGVLKQQGEMESLDPVSLREKHQDWWKKFWDRSWIQASGFPEAQQVNNGYVWQRFMLACAGRGSYPIKFNGSLFTADWPVPGKPVDADYRMWGGCYWFQNTRLCYWAMLGAGDYDEMKPLFQMYREMLPMAEYRSRQWYQHDGAEFFETSNFFGALRQGDYGMDRTNHKPSDVTNTYIRYYWSSGLELSLMMLEYYRCVHDEVFLRDTLLPITRSVLLFYNQNYPTTNGKLVIEPAQSLEQFHNVRNPLPEIAGIHAVVDRLLSVQSPDISEGDRAAWKDLVSKLPPLPVGDDGNGKHLLPAETLIDKTAKNTENPELYAIFPYHLYGIGLPDLDVAKNTFAMRKTKGTEGWRQDAIQAACLGLDKEAAADVLKNSGTSFSGARFKGFWGPNFDWIPDMDHGSVLMIAMQKMLCQTVGNSVYLMPAWPHDWNVDFRLPLGMGDTVTGSYQNGKLNSQLAAPTGSWQIQQQ